MKINYTIFEIFKRVDRTNIPLCSGNFLLKKENAPEIKLKLIDLGIWTAEIKENNYSFFTDNTKFDLPPITQGQTYRIVL